MALNDADKVLIDFAIARFNQNALKNQEKLVIENLSDIAKELNKVFETKERELLVKKYDASNSCSNNSYTRPDCICNANI